MTLKWWIKASGFKDIRVLGKLSVPLNHSGGNGGGNHSGCNGGGESVVYILQI